MKEIELIAPCHFGTEAVLKREIFDLGYDISRVEDGRVFFAGDMEAVARGNICLRTAERVLINMKSYTAATFDELFEGAVSVPWEDFIPKDGRFWVKKASSVKSTLHSIPDIQSIIKKAMVERLKKVYGIEWFPETGKSFPLRVTIIKNNVTLGLDTTGDPLHKRGYRKAQVEAPISETLAAALLDLTPWRDGRILRDPFCGSGTFLIEAAMKAANIAPGAGRHFTSESWTHLISQREWKDIRDEVSEDVDLSVDVDIAGSDISSEAVSISKENAYRAGVGDMLRFSRRDVSKASYHGAYGFILTNPPYGERIGDESTIPALYRALGDVYRKLDKWSLYVITSYEKAPDALGLTPAKNRKIYNGMIRSFFYQFPGPKPQEMKWKRE